MFTKLLMVKNSSFLYLPIRAYSNPIVTNQLNKVKGSYEKAINKYEDFIGLTDVKESQHKVLISEKEFLDKQKLRLEKHRQLDDISNKLFSISQELDKVSKGNERYVQIIQEEYEVLQQKESISSEYKQLEQSEQDSFTKLSRNFRDSHEKERYSSEKVKYWSMMGSLIGAIIGLLGTSINSYFRMNNIKYIINSSNLQTEHLRDLYTEKLEKISQIEHKFITSINELNRSNGKTLESHNGSKNVDKLILNTKELMNLQQSIESLVDKVVCLESTTKLLANNMPSIHTEDKLHEEKSNIPSRVTLGLEQNLSNETTIVNTTSIPQEKQKPKRGLEQNLSNETTIVNTTSIPHQAYIKPTIPREKQKSKHESIFDFLFSLIDSFISFISSIFTKLSSSMQS